MSLDLLHSETRKSLRIIGLIAFLMTFNSNNFCMTGSPAKTDYNKLIKEITPKSTKRIMLPVLVYEQTIRIRPQRL